MSRIGKQPVAIPSGVEVKMEEGKLIVKKGNLTQEVDFGNRVKVKIDNNQIIFEPAGEDKQSRAFWGTYRALTNNAIKGLVEGFEKKLEINGVGYRAQVKGKELELQLGFSHPINYPIPEGIQITVEKNIITVKGHDKQKVGQVAAEIRSFRPPEPYKGKGVKYVDEVIIRKAGKTAKK
ncbi:50S ribosomal protein L6 [Nitratiruptor sp. YY09-18]|uniref:50S ribosomal protein L6 n=1 Tax=Nitratiruptor sp. YY09-18 TaxID=2724901 RepID=UPI001916048D|nr:50S ribosomal protein L6 [Nitratiruptor sp. YY09-18]BCD67374.1 large subunit ribosomal protein L6 [Nitratiruptor sp. YY09-18]